MLFKVICCFALLVVQTKFIWMLEEVDGGWSSWGTVESGKDCVRSPTETYTDNSASGCSGWKQTDLETCKRYCVNNELPENCKPSVANPTCNFVVYNGKKSPGWCHLATSCTTTNKKNYEVVQLLKGKTVPSEWPPRVTKDCTQQTKQKAMYGAMTFSPSLNEKEMTKMNVEVELNDLQFAPYNTKKKGAVYVAYMMKTREGPGGYFGVQFRDVGGQLIFSIWDADRWTNGELRRPKPSSKITWPLNMNRCKRNCQDCGIENLRPWKKTGLTTGTQCKLGMRDMLKKDYFDIHLERLERQFTINTKDYGGMPKGHAAFGEVDREVTGAVWVVKARVKANEMMEVGKILFEGDGHGIYRLSTFDEMIGCNGCNMLYHRDTRYGPFIHDGDGKIRKPIRMRGRTRWKASTCKQYYISGSRANASISFESGPLVSKSFYEDGGSHDVWY